MNAILSFDGLEVRLMKTFGTLLTTLVVCTIAATYAAGDAHAGVLTQGEGVHQAPAQPPALALFGPVAENVVDPGAGDARILRSRAVQVDQSELATLRPSDGATRTIRLFDDVEVRATFKRMQNLPDGAYTWTGTLDDHRFSSFVLAVVDGVMVGQFRSVTRGTFEVRFLRDGVQVIREINPAEVGQCGGAIPIPEAAAGATSPAEPGPDGDGAGHRDSGSTIDVLVVYTTAARIAEGGTTAMRALIAASIADVNLRHDNSVTGVQFRLVGRGEVDYAETGSSSTDLSRLRDPDDSHMDIVHAWRNTYAADVVTLILNTMDSGTAGLGYRPSTLSQMNDASYAFSVVRRTYADDGTMAHEIGHNLGCHHHPDDDSGSGPASGDAVIFPYAFGHRFYAGWWFRTTMAYDPSGAYVRVDYFSDPDDTYNGQPLGIEDERNNAAVIRQTRTAMANHRQSLLPSSVIWADFAGSCPCDGTLALPWVDFNLALAAAPLSGTIAVLPSSTAWAGLINRPVRLIKWGAGVVQIGN